MADGAIYGAIILMASLPRIASSRPVRLLTLLLLLYIGADFVSPSMRGAFCFENHELFIDGVAQAKVAAPVPLATLTSPMAHLPDDGVTRPATRVHARVALPSPRPQWVRGNVKHDDSASFSSSSDSSSTEPSR